MSVILNGLRKAKRFDQREAVLDEAAMVPSAVRHAEPDLKERLAVAIDALPEGCRTVFLLHDVEGYTHEEIGGALEIDRGDVQGTALTRSGQATSITRGLCGRMGA